jgi:uncharacterized protein YaaN involved in tellurite resistance
MSDTAQPNEAATIIDVSKMEPQFLARARDTATQINLSDSRMLMEYGVAAQRKIADFSDAMLSQIRNKDTGYVGEVLGGLLGRIKDLDVGSLHAGGSFWTRIPIIGGFADSIKRFITRYEKLSVQIERILGELETAKGGLLKDISMLDAMFTKNSDYLKDLDVFIAAGQLKLQEVREAVLPALQAKAEASNDPADAQELQDLDQKLVRFEKKLHDLKLSRMVAIQSAPQIRLIQNNNKTLVEKIQSSILTAVPLWKNQVVIAVSLMRQKKALELQRQVSDTTNELLLKNSEMLKQGSLGVAKESERGVVDLETLKKVNADLISTIEETLKIQKEGSEKRLAAESELLKMEGELKARLKTVQAG